MPYGGNWGLSCVAKRGSERRRLAIAVCVLFTACSDAPAPGEPPRATKLAFVAQPTRVEGAVPISPAPQVAILDQFSNTDTNATHPVTVSLAGPSGGTPLNGTTTVYAVAGVATFTDLRIDEPGTDYTLVATAPALQSTTSAPFGSRSPCRQSRPGAHTPAALPPRRSRIAGGGIVPGSWGTGRPSRVSFPHA